MQVTPYDRLAKYYDELFAPYARLAAAARRRILQPVMPGVRTACDLACGTGATALALARQGIPVFGVDLCGPMCRVTREKARREALPVRVLRADMRRFRLPEPVDLVLCEFDAINHVPRKPDLALVARAVARALRPGGHFYFDVNNRLSFRKLWPLAWFHDRPDVALVMHGGYDRRRDKGWSDLDWFLRDGRRWRRVRDRVEEVCWEPAEIRGALHAAGFDRVSASDAQPFFPRDSMIGRGCRTFYLARKARV